MYLIPNFKSLFRPLEQFFLIVGQNNFGNKIHTIISREMLKKKACTRSACLVGFARVLKSALGNLQVCVLHDS